MKGKPNTPTISLSDCRENKPTFQALIGPIAADFSVPPRQLTVRTLMQLPRIATSQGKIELARLKDEIAYVAEILAADIARYQKRAGIPEASGPVSTLTFGPLEEDAARHMFECLHNLKSYREDSEAYGLFTPDTHQVVAACTVSPLQWSALGDLLERTTGVGQADVFDISRVYCHDVAPKNSVSTLLSRVRKAVRQKYPEAALLSTVVDQNLGFSGGSYVASNWRRWSLIEPRPYLYIDRNPVTIRQLQETYADRRWEELLQEPSTNFEMSAAPLLDSLVFIQPLKHGAVEALPHQEYRLKRQS